MASQNEPRNGGIINPLFDGLTYNTCGHFAHCSYSSSPPYGARKNTTQLAKYPHLLYVKPSNKVYMHGHTHTCVELSLMYFARSQKQFLKKPEKIN